jgi:hypothetical protein
MICIHGMISLVVLRVTLLPHERDITAVGCDDNLAAMLRTPKHALCIK